MNCSSVDLKGYALGETAGEPVAAHVAVCESCREELDRLRLTETALRALAEEEARRIAFVSDKIFEPRWWQRAWQSAPAMGFLSALVLAGAILAHAYAPRPAAPVPAGVDRAAIEARIETEVARRVDRSVTQAVGQAVAESEARQKTQTAQLLDAAEKRYDFDRKADLVSMKEAMRYYEMQLNRWTVASNTVDASRMDAANQRGAAQ